MSNLTTEITIEELQYRINAHENDLTQMWTADYFLSVQKELLALKQAAKNPVAWIVHMRTGDQFTTDGDFVGLGEATHGIHSTPLYAAPVLPKQPELLSIGELLQRLEVQTGEKWVEESAQHVIPGQLTQRMAEEKALSLGAVLYDEEADIFADGWNACRAEMLKAQPVSEPYKLPDGWVMVPQQIFLDASDIESICSQCGDGHKSGYGDFTDGLLWVGDIQCDNGTIMHGLHISSSDYQEEGGLTLAEFKAPVQESE